MLEYATLGEMAGQVGIQIGDSSSDKAAAIKAEINRRYSILARQHRWKELLRVSEEQFSTTASQVYLYLPKEVEQLFLIFPQNGMPPLQGRSLDQLIDEYTSQYRAAGATVNFAEAGEVGYRTDFLTSGEALTITHSGTGTIEAVVRGLVGGAEGVIAGNETVEVVSVLQSVGATTTNTWTDLGAVSVQELADGDLVTVTGASSGRVYAQIASGERTARYKRIRLMQPTITGDAVTLIWKKRIARLKEDNQAIEIPLGNVLVDECVATMLSSVREYGGAGLHYQRAEREVEKIRDADSTDDAIIHQATPGMPLSRGFRYGNWNGY